MRLLVAGVAVTSVGAVGTRLGLVGRNQLEADELLLVPVALMAATLAT
ncbi:MAG: hypothetical protein U0R64_08820 [Candidatus Nanopelagicales bacterium]